MSNRPLQKDGFKNADETLLNETFQHHRTYLTTYEDISVQRLLRVRRARSRVSIENHVFEVVDHETGDTNLSRSLGQTKIFGKTTF